MAKIDDFAVFILTHGRPNRVKTFNTLLRQGYTGNIFIIIDNEDKTADEYKKRFGEKVIIFDKLAISKTFDTGDNFNDRRAVVYARNACFDIAKNLGINYFLQLDDDYTDFRYKFTSSLKYVHKLEIKNLDKLFKIILDYYKNIDVATIALGQGGDVIGGSQSSTGTRLWLKRKCMNSFFCSTRRQFSFFGRINEDVNTYVLLGNRGKLMFTIFNAAINQVTTQTNKGGMTEMYLSTGTYVKSFYTVMYAPSCVRVGQTGTTHLRIHHRISWNNAVPKIISEKYRKTEVD